MQAMTTWFVAHLWAAYLAIGVLSLVRTAMGSNWWAATLERYPTLGNFLRLLTAMGLDLGKAIDAVLAILGAVTGRGTPSRGKP